MTERQSIQQAAVRAEGRRIYTTQRFNRSRQVLSLGESSILAGKGLFGGRFGGFAGIRRPTALAKWLMPS
jgi:hypothetical protein